MNLYHLARPDADSVGYDEYDSAVVAAESEDDARTIHPNGWCRPPVEDEDPWQFTHDWCPMQVVVVRLIGIASEGTERGVICASFNAG